MYPIAIFIGGPTASGKTELAFYIQSQIKGFIVNADSMQVYDKLGILTNRPNEKNIKKYDCNLFGFIKYPKKCNVGYWQKESLSILNKKKELIPIFVGGTGLYINSLINNISDIPLIPEEIRKAIQKTYKKKGKDFLFDELKKINKDYAKKISPNDIQRLIRALEVKYFTGISFSEWHRQNKKKIFKRIIYVILNTERNILYTRINNRCEEMVKEGVLDEIKKFLKIKTNSSHPLHKSIGLQSMEKYFSGEVSKEESLKAFMRDTRRYAKRQLTWFNNKAKGGIKLEFSDAKDYILERSGL